MEIILWYHQSSDTKNYFYHQEFNDQMQSECWFLHKNNQTTESKKKNTIAVRYFAFRKRQYKEHKVEQIQSQSQTVCNFVYLNKVMFSLNLILLFKRNINS